ncbi:MAG: TM2 domain-containing protein, partial [Mucilaginibacter sp.]
FFAVAGIQRFVLGQIAMGILYLFTGGFCLIGTIVDLVNNRSLTLEYNQKMVYEAFQVAKMSN